MHGEINNLVGISVFPLRGASWTVLPYPATCPAAGSIRYSACIVARRVIGPLGEVFCAADIGQARAIHCNWKRNAMAAPTDRRAPEALCPLRREWRLTGPCVSQHGRRCKTARLTSGADANLAGIAAVRRDRNRRAVP